MAYTSDFKPFATGTGALVLTPDVLATETWLYNGFAVGVADPASCNTVWRQSSFVAAGITAWMAQILQQDIIDDGNLNNFQNLFGSAIQGGSQSGVTSFDGRKGAVTLTATDVTTALGFSPVASFNGRSGQVVLNSVDVNNALGYQPVNRGGDTMAQPLAGPSPIATGDYATKGYVDSQVGGALRSYTGSNGITLSGLNFTLSQIPNNTVLGNISGQTTYPYALAASALVALVKAGLPNNGIVSGSSSEYNIPLTCGVIIKVGHYPSSVVLNGTYTVNFASSFAHICAGVFVQIDNTGVSLGSGGPYSATLVSEPTTSGFSFRPQGYNSGDLSGSAPGPYWVAFGW